MLETHVHRNYLSRLAFTGDAAEARYQTVNLLARVLCPINGVKSFATFQVRIVSISETGAVLQARNITSLTDHFYLCLGQFEIVLTCTRTKRQEGSLFVRFLKPEESSFIRALAMIDFPLTTLQRLRGHSSRGIQMRITQPGMNI